MTSWMTILLFALIGLILIVCVVALIVSGRRKKRRMTEAERIAAAKAAATGVPGDTSFYSAGQAAGVSSQSIGPK